MTFSFTDCAGGLDINTITSVSASWFSFVISQPVHLTFNQLSHNRIHQIRIKHMSWQFNDRNPITLILATIISLVFFKANFTVVGIEFLKALWSASSIILVIFTAILGAQTAGGGIGTSIAPGNIVLGTTTAGILGSEGKVLRKNIPFALAVATVYGLIIFLMPL